MRWTNSTSCAPRIPRTAAQNTADGPRAAGFGRVQLAIDEGCVEDQLSPLIGDLCLPPVFDLALHRLEVPLDPVHSDSKSVNQIEALAVFGQDRSEHPWNNVSKSLGVWFNYPQADFWAGSLKVVPGLNVRVARPPLTPDRDAGAMVRSVDARSWEWLGTLSCTISMKIPTPLFTCFSIYTMRDRPVAQ